MADFTTKWRIEGENGTQKAFNSILGDAQKTSDKVSGFFKRAFVGFSMASVAFSLKNAASAAIEFGDEVQKASARTGLGASQFALLAQSAKLADVEMDTLSKGLRALQISVSRAGSGAKGPLETFAALGIEFEKFHTLDASQQLEVLADHLLAIKDPADRARAGADLLGRAWQDMAPYLLQGSEGMRAAREEIEKLGGAQTDEQIKKLADADDSIKRLSASWDGFARTLTAAVAPALTKVFDILSGEEAHSRQGLETSIGFALAKLHELEKRREPYTQPGYDKSTLAHIDQQIAETRKRLGELRIELNALDGSKGPTSRGGGGASAIVAPGYKPPDPKGDKAKALEYVLPAELQAVQEAQDELVRLYYEGLKLEAQSAETISDITEEGLKDLDAEMLDTFEGWFEATDQLSVFAEEAARGMQNSFADFLFDPFKDGLKGMLAGFVDLIRRMVAEAMAAQILRSFFEWGASTFSGGLGSFFGSMSNGIGTRAGGGDMAAGMPYLTGEKGPELVIPKVGSTVIPNHKLALAGGRGDSFEFNYSIDARGADAERIMSIIPPMLQRTKQETIAEVRNLMNRGRM